MKHLLLLPFIILSFSLANAQTVRYFEFTTSCGHGNWQDTAFVAATSDPVVIDSVLANIARPMDQRKFIAGPIDYGNAGVNRNASHWFLWHFVPNEWELADFAIEVCDGCPYTDVDADTAYWVGNIGQFCPWSGKPVREVSLVSEVSDPGFGETATLFYPNPAQDFITLNLRESEDVAIQLFNAIGQALVHIPDAKSQPTIDIAHLQQGIYYLKFTKDNNTVTKKLVVKGE